MKEHIKNTIKMKYLIPYQNNYEVCLLLHLLTSVPQGFEFRRHLCRLFFLHLSMSQKDLHLILS